MINNRGGLCSPPVNGAGGAPPRAGKEPLSPEHAAVSNRVPFASDPKKHREFFVSRAHRPRGEIDGLAVILFSNNNEESEGWTPATAEDGNMTRHELELLDTEYYEAFCDGRSHHRRQRPRSHNVSFSRQRRRPGVPLGIHARGRQRSTFRSLHRGRVGQAVVLLSSQPSVSTPCNPTAGSVAPGQL